MQKLPRRLLNAVIRIGYVCAMFSGVRAIFNRCQAIARPSLRAAVLNGHTLQLPNGESVELAVHGRSSLSGRAEGHLSGMISVRLNSAGTSHPLYSLLCLTSHFGCGHIEIVFYESNDAIVLYGIRNMLRANARRIGCERLFEEMPLQSADDEVFVLRQIRHAFHNFGLATSLATPQECVDLAVNNRLLHPARALRARSALKRRYARMWKQVAVGQCLSRPSNPIDTMETFPYLAAGD